MGSQSGITGLFDLAWRRLSAFFRASPLIAFPATSVAVLAVGGLLVWAFGFNGGFAGSSSTPTPTVTSTPRPTATPTKPPTPTVTSTPMPVQAESSGGSSNPSSGGSSSPGVGSDSGMRFKIPSIGVDAPVTVRVIGEDGVMEPPNGRFDVVWYDFSAYGGVGGYPGSGGNAVFSGHVDYHPNYEAVFWDLHLVGPGDLIEVDLPDGTAVHYSVQWSQTISPDTDFGQFVGQTGEETITIVTCQGTFNSATHQYDQRLVVRGVRVP